MAKTYDTSTDRGLVRLNVADTDEDNATFTDAEVDVALTEGGSVAKATAILFRVLAAAALKKGESAIAASYLAMAGEYDPSISTVTIGLPALLPSDSGFTEPTT